MFNGITRSDLMISIDHFTGRRKACYRFLSNSNRHVNYTKVGFFTPPDLDAPLLEAASERIETSHGFFESENAKPSGGFPIIPQIR